MTRYRFLPLVQGFPGKSTEHGGLGWSSVTLLDGGGRLVLVDSGGFGMRSLLESRLDAHGIAPADVTDVLLSHAHYDHAANYPLFPRAAVWISAVELDWATSVGATFMPLPELYAADLATSQRTRRITADGEFLPGIEAFAVPGHTPGSLVFRAAGEHGPILFSGDAAKNRAELLSTEADMSLDPAASGASIRRIRALWRESPSTLLVPGHDVPLRWSGEQPHYDGERRAGIRAWFGTGLSDTTFFDLTTEGTR
ncbi:MBL fold metallo-hydrolase [Amycolatopsis thermophila]|uniref:Glyoxylase-like metal-dependent hydrolase (Beta-lactamase superfamily II) n=1 Tax=Amycolatopsis thermophila TaxID=206084 RepID=A0ABU0F668_9PSEU|nr:MBL fold metallo-hydrolase [Amycolatopsis thermophila]MDQ0383022.1 glyoxylase-like metal-dependent hydrolase (beta-lactamase superfamily II) [Amycolatopsis thermophila]